MGVPDVVSVIYNEIAGDDCNNSASIIEKYEAMNDEQKHIVDDFLMDICGWTMDSLIDLARDREYFVEE